MERTEPMGLLCQIDCNNESQIMEYLFHYYAYFGIVNQFFD